MGEQGFASALFYTYVCISRDLLVENTGGNEELAKRTIAALTETALTVSPTGKQNSFASRAYATMRWPKSGKNNRVLWRRHFSSRYAIPIKFLRQ